MSPQSPNAFDSRKHELLWRWITVVAALYAVVLIAMTAIIVPGDARHDTGSLDGISDEIDVIAAWESARATAARLAAETTGVGHPSISDAHEMFNKPAGAWQPTSTAPAVQGAEAPDGGPAIR
jgi:hypothetical protein